MDEVAMDTAFEPEDWLRQNEALRRVARALVRDDSRTDDVVQNAYLAALERPPVRASAAWLRGVVRSRAFDALRRDRRRREAPLAESELPAAPDFTRQLELHRALVDAVGELPEPYQRVVYLRFFEGRTPAEIAVALDAPVKTVKTRLNRALARLRERLGREYGPDSWQHALVATFWPGSKAALEWLGTATVAGGVSIMSKNIVLVAVALALAVWGVAQWKSTGGAPTRPHAAEVAAPEAALAAPPEEDLARVSEELAERVPAEADPADEPPAVVAAPTTGTLIVRAFWADGTAAVGVGIHLRSGRRGSGFPTNGLDREASDERGVARFEHVAPGTAEVNADRTDFGNALGVEISAGEETDVEFTIASGVAVEGIVRDAGGAAVAGASIWLTTGLGDWQGGQVIAMTLADGRFQLRDVPHEQSLGAFAPGHGRSALVDLEAMDTERQPVRVDLELTVGGGTLRGIVTGPDGEPVAGATVSAGDYASTDWGMGRLRTERWSPRAIKTDEDGGYAMAGLPAGDLQLRARAMGTPTWKGSVAILDGETTRADIALTAEAIVEGTVRNVKGEPVEGAIVRAFDEEISLHFIQGGQYDYEDPFGYPATTSDAEGRYRLAAIPQGEVFLYANPPRDRSVRQVAGVMRAQEVLQAEPGDQLRWDPVLSEGHVIEGIVTYRDGHPMPRVFISARNDETGVAQSIVNGEDGTFRFVNMDNAPHVLGVQLWSPPDDAEPVEARDVWPDRGGVELVASFDKPVELENGTVRGVIDDAGERAENPDLLAPILESDRNFARVFVKRDGMSFVFPGVEPGRYRPVILVAENPVFRGDWITLEPGQDLDLGTLKTEPGGSVLVHFKRDEATQAVEPRLYFHSGGMYGRSVELAQAEEMLVDNMSAGEYTVSVYATGMVSMSEVVTVEAGKQAELTLEPAPAVRRAIEVTWPENEKLGALTIRVENELGDVLWDSTQPNVAFLKRPYTQSPNLTVGHYTVTAESKTGLRGTAQFAILNLEQDQPVVMVEMR